MKIEYRHLSAAALTLFLCLLIAPFAPAAQAARDGDRAFDVPQAITRTINKLKKIVRGITTFEDVPAPPRP